MATPSFSDMGKTDVLLIVSNPSTSHPLVIPRRPNSELSNAERVKLENQGVTKEHHKDDVSIMKARYALDKDCIFLGVEQDGPDKVLTASAVKRRIADILANTKNQSVIFHYIGAGKKGTGDWCFSDGFISFRDLMNLYLVQRRPQGRPTLFISSDCSHSGSWVKDGMAFMDEKGVGPCGHVAKEKDMQLTVQASCLSTEVPQELSFSVHSVKNDKNTGCVLFMDFYRNKAIADDQHPTKLNFYSIMCRNEADKPCTMAPGSTWKTWKTSQRLCVVTNTDNIQPKWNVVLFKDNDSIICSVLLDKTETENLVDHVQVIKSGWGKDPPDDIQEWLQQNYKVDYGFSMNDMA